MKKVNTKLILLTILFSLVFFWTPLPYFIEMPGTSEDLREHVLVNGEKDEYKGSFMLTTVAVQQATPFTYLTSLFNHKRELVSKKEMMGGSNSEEYEQMQTFYMKNSQNMASKVVLDLLDKPYEMSYQGVYVMSITENSDFKEKLSIGNTISKIDGKKIESSEELIKLVQSKQVNDVVTLTVSDERGEKEVSGKLIELEGTKKTGIGISLIDHTELVSEEKIEFLTHDVGGPSAGLMFTLELYSLLSQTDLRNGLEIAGTGTMNSTGEVGRIGGIDKKVIAAEHAGADVFFAPDDELTEEMRENYPEIKSNFEEAQEAVKKNRLKLTVVPIKTVEDAVTYLKNKK